MNLSKKKNLVLLVGILLIVLLAITPTVNAQEEKQARECSVDTDCKENEVCKVGVCTELVCREGYKAIEHKCIEIPAAEPEPREERAARVEKPAKEKPWKEEAVVIAPGKRGRCFRNAYWQCYDGYEAKEGGRTSCKSSDVWKKYAEEACRGRCSERTGKCGVNSFSIYTDCRCGWEAEVSGEEKRVKEVILPYERREALEEEKEVEEKEVEEKIEEEMEEKITSLEERPHLLNRLWSKIKLMQERIERQAKRISVLEKRLARLEALFLPTVTEPEPVKKPVEERREGKLVVTVFDKNKRPVEGARVTVTAVSPEVFAKKVLFAEKTNSQGKVTFKLPTGRYLVRAEALRRVKGLPKLQYFNSGRVPTSVVAGKITEETLILQAMKEREEAIIQKGKAGIPTVPAREARIIQRGRAGKAGIIIQNGLPVEGEIKIQTAKAGIIIQNGRDFLARHLMKERNWNREQALEHLKKLRNAKVKITVENEIEVEYEQPNETPILNWIIPTRTLREEISQEVIEEFTGGAEEAGIIIQGGEPVEIQEGPVGTPPEGLVGESNPQPSP